MQKFISGQDLQHLENPFFFVTFLKACSDLYYHQALVAFCDLYFLMQDMPIMTDSG